MIHFHAKTVEISLNQLHHGRDGELTHGGKPFPLGATKICISNLGFKGLTHLDQVIAWIGAILKGHSLTMRLEIAQIHRTRQNIDLRPAIIDVIFARHVISCVIQQAGQSIAKDRAARMAHMQGPCRVGRHIFDIHLAPLPDIDATIGTARLRNAAQHLAPCLRRKAKVQKAWPRHISGLNPWVGHQDRGQCIGDITWL